MAKSKERINAYALAITNAMQIIDLRNQIGEHEGAIKSLLTYSELVDGKYDDELVNEAFEQAQVSLVANSYVGSTCVLNSAEVNLHGAVGELGRDAMKNVFSEAKVRK